MDYNKSKAQNRVINNTRGPQSMGDNGPKKIFGKVSSGSNKSGLSSSGLYGKLDSAGSSSGVGGKMTETGYPSPPRQSMASAGAAKTTTMKMGGGTVHAEMQIRGGGKKPKSGGSGY